MASQSTLRWVQRLVWIGIYSGLLAIVLGVFLNPLEPLLAASIQGVGAVLLVAGLVLIYVRSRLQEPPSDQNP